MPKSLYLLLTLIFLTACAPAQPATPAHVSYELVDVTESPNGFSFTSIWCQNPETGDVTVCPEDLNGQKVVGVSDYELAQPLITDIWCQNPETGDVTECSEKVEGEVVGVSEYTQTFSFTNVWCQGSQEGELVTCPEDLTDQKVVGVSQGAAVTLFFKAWCQDLETSEVFDCTSNYTFKQ